ncbi:MAG: methyl-accepting chemotaxis protein [Pseudomonadota bacterium]
MKLQAKLFSHTKIHTKLIVSLLAGLIVVVALAQLMQYFGMTGLISDLSESNMRLLKEREEENAKNLFRSLEQAVAGSLERGEMEKFTKLLEAQQEVEGLLEFSLYDRDGIVSHSSDPSFLKKKLPQDIKNQLLSAPEMLLRHAQGELEIYQPQKITGDCIRCHMDWKIGAIGGITHCRFSTEALRKAENQATATIADTQGTSLRNCSLTVLGIIVVSVIAMYLLVKKFVGRPLGRFIHLLKQSEGDLTRRMPITTQDEIGELAGWFNSFMGKLNNAIGHAQAAAFSVGSGASQQAAAVEETSASMEEMATMTKHNASNAQEANSLMTEVSQEIHQANDSMNTLTRAMEGLSEASNKTAKIIKTIDEIAFQTNLLALNAAVEAARAGEAGAGFAVVADEVRNLAMRAAEAADTTSELIEDTLKKIEDSGELVGRTSAAFEEVADRSKKAAALIKEIAAASQEQAQGIEQVNKSLVEMDKTTQENAAQSEELTASMSTFKTNQSTDKKLIQAKIAAAVPTTTAAIPKSAEGITPEEIIPMEEEFKDF